MPLWPPFTRLPCSASLFPCNEKGPARGLFHCRNRTSSHREKAFVGTEAWQRRALALQPSAGGDAAVFVCRGAGRALPPLWPACRVPVFLNGDRKRGCRTGRHPRKHLWRNSGKGARRAGPWIMPREQRQPGIFCRGSWYGRHPACRRRRLPLPSAGAAAAGWR